MLTVLGRSEKPTKHGDSAMWICRCDCGAIVEKKSEAIRRSKMPSCGCAHREQTSFRCLSEMVGKTFGRLVVLERATKVGEKPVKWKCRCSCGNVTNVTTYSLKSGATKSCGCIHSEQLASRNATHGKSYTRLYHIWRGMKARCYIPTATSYRYYGAKGVRMCDDWRESFESFQEWSLANGFDPDLPSKMCTIDRVDPSGDYSPDNCRWADMSVQNKNKRSRS